jgi:hypothetical protein
MSAEFVAWPNAAVAPTARIACKRTCLNFIIASKTESSVFCGIHKSVSNSSAAFIAEKTITHSETGEILDMGRFD